MAKAKFEPKSDKSGVSFHDLVAMADYLKEAKYKNEVALAVLGKMVQDDRVPADIAKEAAFWVGYMQGTTALIRPENIMPNTGQEVMGWLHDERRYAVVLRDETGEWLENVPPGMHGLMEQKIRYLRYPETAVTYWFILPGPPWSDYAKDEEE